MSAVLAGLLTARWIATFSGLSWRPLGRIELDHVLGRRLDDSLDKGGQRTKRVALFRRVVMAVVDALDAADRVAKDALSDFRPDAGAAHQTARRASQIVQPPINAQHPLRLGKVLEVVTALTADED